MRKYMQGQFKPKNPAKYRGDVNNIYYRSSWELSAMCNFDKDPNVIEWSSEETVIPYISPIDGKPHRYFIDFKVKFKSVNTVLIEIKPASQTQPPKQPKRVTKRFLTEAAEFGKNQAKWKAAREYAVQRGWTFQVWTEKELGIWTK